MMFRVFFLASVVVNQNASTKADVESKIDKVLKHASDKIAARGCGKIYKG